MPPVSKWEEGGLPGLLVFSPAIIGDDRGFFVKSFNYDAFAAKGVRFEVREEFYSSSTRDVIRGMHFQLPPFDHAKLVTCLTGTVLDVVVDLRKSQPTFGKSWAIELSDKDRQVLYIPIGFAHGFATLSEEALVHYKTDNVYSKDHDTGVLWNSFGFKWPTSSPIVSPRDAAFPALDRFASPF